MSIAQWEFEHARRFENEIGLIWRERAWTNLELHMRGRRFAAVLLALGVKPGDRVAVALGNSPELFTACSGALIAGAAKVVLGDTASAELQAKAAHCEPRVIVCSPHLTNVLAESSPEATIVGVGDSADVLRFDHLIERVEPLDELVDVPDSSLAQLCYTSGSTGKSKAVPYTHGELGRYLRSFAQGVPDRTAATTYLVCAPPTAFGSRLVTLRVVGNSKYVLLPQFDPERTLAAVEKYRVEHVSLLPTMAEQLVAISSSRTFDCSSLRSIFVGGSHVPTALVTGLKRLASNGKVAESALKVAVRYGTTEAGGEIAETCEGGDGIVGRILPGVTVRIVRNDGTDAQPGEIGEIVARTVYGPQGYWRDREQSASVFRNGFVHTGDLGFLRDDHQLCLAGRAKDMIIQGGVNVYPAELTKVIYSIPGVRECAVVGCPNQVLGEEVVVCVVRRDGADLNEPLIRTQCRLALEPGKQPVRILFFDELPKQDGGKVDLQALRLAASQPKTAAGRPAAVSMSEARQIVESELRVILSGGVRSLEATEPLDPRVPFGELGLDSHGAVRLAYAVQARVGVDVPATLAYSHTTIEACARWLAALGSVDPSATSQLPAVESSGRQPVAIVGIGVRLPGGAGTPGEFWELLWNGLETVRDVPVDRRTDPSSSWRAAFLSNAGDFDAPFFRLTADAAEVDPRHRQLLEVFWEALEDAGVDPTATNGERVGVFLGMSGEQYPSRDRLGAAVGMAAGRLCHFFDFRGPVLTLDTTCSSSLVAVHHAVESLRRQECDLALVGSSNLLGERYSADPLGVISSDGVTRAFDAAANGFGQGEGSIALVLRRLEDAQRSGDRVYASMLGSAINHDGRSSSLTAPNPQSQARVIALAQHAAGVVSEHVQYIEAHGTGTLLGDPIEIEGIARSAGQGRRVPLVLGSVKSNIGHLEAAAGLAGVVKVALAIWHRRLPASLHCTNPNPLIRWNEIPARVQSVRGEWPEPDRRLIAGVSSFGLSGTNAHVVIADCPQDALPSRESDDAHAGEDERWMLPISARTEPALRTAIARWLELLERDDPLATCSDVAYTASCRRAHLPFRAAVFGSSRREWASRLREYLASRAGPASSAAHEPRRLALVFSDQGSQWHGMATHLFAREPVFRDALTRCAKLLDARSGWSVIAELHRDVADSRINATDVTQPALFAVQVALYELWKSWGVEGVAAVGHGAGEVAAAYAAGLLTLEEASHIACERGRLCHESPRGAMLAVAASPAEAERFCAEAALALETAAINGPRSVVLSGSMAAAQKAFEILRSRGVRAAVLASEHAFHSRQMEAAASALGAAIADPAPHPPRMRLISAMTGEAVERLNGDYWSRQLLEPIRFQEAVAALLREGCTAFLEIGPDPVLLPAIEETIASRAGPEGLVTVGSLRRDAGGARQLLESLGRLYCSGVPINWERWFPRHGKHVDLPRYPWEHVRYWHHRTPERSDPSGDSIKTSGDPISGAPEASAEIRSRIIAAWSDALDVPADEIAGPDDFFALGGDSFRAVELIGAFNQQYGIDLELTDVFEQPDLERFTALVLSKVEKATCAAAAQTILRADRSRPLTASSIQKRMWFLEQFSREETDAHSADVAVWLRGSLDGIAMEKAINTIVQRHECLRTVVFMDDGGNVLQRIEPPGAVSLPVVSLAEADVGGFQAAFSGERLDISTTPLLKAALLDLGSQRHVLLIRIHDIAYDGWSNSVLMKEFSALYNAYCKGERDPLAPLDLQYADYSHWKSQRVSPEAVAHQMRYWQMQLAGAPELLELPTDRRRSGAFRGDALYRMLPRSLLNDLRDLSRDQGTTLFSTLMAAFNVLLWRLSGALDIPIGTLTSDRVGPGLENLIGPLLNTIVFRTRLNPRASFRGFLGQVDGTARAAYRNQDVPFEEVVQAGKHERASTHTPLFQVMFAMQNTPESTLALWKLELEKLEVLTRGGRLDLFLRTRELKDGLWIWLEYNADLFEKETVETWLDLFASLLHGIATDPDRPLADALADEEDRGLSVGARDSVVELSRQQV